MAAVATRDRPRTPPGESGGAIAPPQRSRHIEGRYRPLSVHQLTLAYWLYSEKHITRRQLRVYFAAHEIAERRRYTLAEPDRRGRTLRPRTPRFTVEEFARLVGDSGRGGRDAAPRAEAELRADIKTLDRIGLVSVTATSIRFAVSADEIRIDDLGGFWAMFSAMPNRRRAVPVPRRTLRALAAGFSKGVTALVVAVLIRGLFWHRETGAYRTDGRYKLSWVAEHFSVSRRAATEARARLIELGWIEPLEVKQWELNKWGLRDRIDPEWSPPAEQAEAVGGSEHHSDARPGEREPVGHCADADSASPSPVFAGESASPDQTNPLSLSGDRKTRRPAAARSAAAGEAAGVFVKKNRKNHTIPDQPRARPRGPGRRPLRSCPGHGDRPNIRDIRAADLASTERLLELHRQAAALGLISASEAGRLDFLALAERARTRGNRAGALLYWLVSRKKTAFITLHDEDEASRRLREHLSGPRMRKPPASDWGSGGVERARDRPELTEEQKFVVLCVRVAKQHRGLTPFDVARFKGWKRKDFERVMAEVDRIDRSRWSTVVSPRPNERGGDGPEKKAPTV